MIYGSKNNTDSEAETELVEDKMTDQEKSEGVKSFAVSQDPHDEEKVLSIVEKTNLFFADQGDNESVEEVELVEVGKTDSQKKNVADDSQDKIKALHDEDPHDEEKVLSMVEKNKLILC